MTDAPLSDTEAQARDLLDLVRKPRRRVRPRLAEPLRDAVDREVDTSAGPVMAWRLGSGPAVLLVHGWEDDNALWAPLIDRFVEIGRAVVVMDLPGHGFSRAELDGAKPATEAIQAVADALGPVDAIVAHSFGCPASVSAMRAGLTIQRAVMIAPAIPSRRGWVGRLAERGVPEAVVQRLGELIPPAYDVEADAPAMTAAVLFVHALDDEETPVEHSETLAALWPGARLALAEGLGHRLVAQDAAMLARVVEFVG